jgi:two-component system, response regulator
MNNKAILLVEDNPSDRDLTKRALERARIFNQLVVAEDGQEALDYLYGRGAYAGRDILDLPTVVLLDINLPKLNGLEVLQHIRSNEITKLLPVVMLTTSDQEQDVVASYNLGANSYIRKPVDFHQFAAAIQHWGIYWLLLNEIPSGSEIPVGQ